GRGSRAARRPTGPPGRASSSCPGRGRRSRSWAGRYLPAGGQPLVDPPAHRVVAAGEEPGVVRVQALHALAGAPPPARRAWAGVARGGGGGAGGRPLVDPPAHRVVAAGEEPGVVRVQALHALAGAPHPARRAWAGVARGEGGVALGGVAGVGGRQLVGVDRGLGGGDPAVALEL